MKTFEDVLKISIDAVPYIPGHDDGSYKEGFVDGLEHAQELLDIHKGAAIREIATDVLNWLNENPLEWEYGGDVDDIINNYFKSKK